VRVVKKVHDTTCDHKVVDMTSATAKLVIAAPTVTTTFARQAAGSSGAVTAIVSVAQRKPDGTWKEIASSWPSTGLAGAGVPIPALGASTGAMPPLEGLGMSTTPAGGGGVNTGQPESFCAPSTTDLTAPPGDGVTTDGLGDGAPAYYEVGEPTGDYAGQAPKGVMFVIHGGGWYAVGPGLVQTERYEADYWRARGWRTINLTYSGCAQDYKDVTWFYDHARSVYGSTMPFCLLGGSAGGNLALLVAWHHPDAACVIDEGGPTDMMSIPNQTAFAAKNPAGQTDGPRWVYNMGAAAFGQDLLAFYSPALFQIHARILVGVSAADPYIPFAQATELRDKQLARDPGAYVDIDQLEAGDQQFMHANVSQAALDDFHQREDALVAPLVNGSS